MITNGLVTRHRMGARGPAMGPTAEEAEPEGCKTSSKLLDRVRDWGDHPAWADFFECYDPLLHRWCARFDFDGDASDELCQRIWVELMTRMRTFRYDPSRGFRRWLWRLFWSRAIDFYRQRRTAQNRSFEELLPSSLDRHLFDREPAEARESDGDDTSLLLVSLAEEAQAAVRARVDPETWRAYWIVAIEDRPIREAADCLGKTYTAVYAGYRRIDRMLRTEGQRRLAGLLAPDSSPS